ncbi:MAG: DUF190 domain-containing protein [Alphaproteobacteria bacterium]|nr:DUF190 domain-containing protein [Alphaproteobacteria bacterium]
MTALPQKCKRMNIYVGGHNRHNGLPLYEAIVMSAKRAELAGLTVFSGLMSYGHLKLLEGARLEGEKLSNEQPVLIQIIEDAEKLQSFMPEVLKILGTHGLVTLEDVEVLHSA